MVLPPSIWEQRLKTTVKQAVKKKQETGKPLTKAEAKQYLTPAPPKKEVPPKPEEEVTPDEEIITHFLGKEKETTIPFTEPTTEPVLGMGDEERIQLEKMKPEPIKYRPAYIEAEKQIGTETGLIQEQREKQPIEYTYAQYVKWKRVQEQEETIKRLMRGTPEERVAGLGLWVTSGMLSWRDPFGAISAAQALTGDIEGAIQTKARAMLDLNVAIKQGWESYFAKVYTSPLILAGVTYGVSAGVGTGIGAVKAAFPTIGSLVEKGLVGYSAYEIGKPLVEGDIEKFYSGVLSAAILSPVAIPGYKAGYRYGFGKTEAYLYKIHTYKPGSKEFIRFEEALKVGELLKDVPGLKKKPIDFAKDIMRIKTPETAEKIMGFIKTHKGKVIIGGSGAARMQVAGARVGRDIDIYFLGSKKQLASAKTFFKKEIAGDILHIHGKEMFGIGKVHKFWFVSQEPIKIDGVKAVRAGELTARKAISSVLFETRYRHGIYPGFPKKGTMQAPKDIADLVTHAVSQIESAKKHLFIKWKGTLAEKHLETFLHPWKKPIISKELGLVGRFLKKTTVRPEPIQMIDYTGQPYYGFAPAKIPYLSYTIPIALPIVYPISPYLKQPTQPMVYPSVYKEEYHTMQYEQPYKKPYQPPYKPAYQLPQQPVGYPTIYQPPGYQPPYQPTIKQPPYQPPYEPPTYQPPYKPPYKPPYQPPYYPPSYPPPYPPEKPPRIVITKEKPLKPLEKKDQGYSVYVKERYIVHGKKVRPEQFKKIRIHALSESDAHSLGAYLVDQSAAASFKVKPIDVKAKPLRLGIDPWSFNQGKFYLKGNIYIEKTAHRIDTPGEIEGITAQGLLTRMQKTQKPYVSKVKPRVTREKPMFEDIFTTDFNKMEKNMMKMMNRGF